MRSILSFFIWLLLSVSPVYGAVQEENSGQSKIEQQLPQIQDKEDEKLRLIYQVFIYATDLKNAYKTVKLALKRRPNSLYWHYKMAEVASWLGKGQDAIKSMDYIYRHTHNIKIKKKILKSALQLYQYEIAAPLIKEEALKNPTEKNIKDMVYVYNQIGKPEIAAKVLEQLSKKKGGDEDFLREALKVYTLLGDKSSAERVIKALSKFKRLKVETAREISNFYIPQRKLKEAYKALLRAWRDDIKDKSYLLQISDIGWYIKDFKHSAKASKRLMELKSARIIDYERIISYYNGKNPQIVERASFESFQKHKRQYLLSTYMNMLFMQKKYKKLYKTMKNIEANPNLFKYFKKDTNYYLMKAELLKKLKLYKEAEKTYKKLIELKPNSSEFRVALFWLYIDTKNIKKLKSEIFEMEENLNIDKNFYLPLGMAHYFLHNIDRAINYIKLVREKKRSIDTDFTYAYLMQLRGDEDAFYKTMKNIFDYLEKKLSENPSLINNSNFLGKYLESGIYFIESDKFEKLLKESKTVLPRDKYLDLSLAWSQKNDSLGMRKIISKKLSTPKPWVDMGIALSEDDFAKVQKLIYRYYITLPPLDSAIGAKESGNIAFAESLIFEAGEKNRQNATIYRIQREYSDEYGSRASLESGVNGDNFDNLKYVKGDVSHYVARGYYIDGGFKYAENSKISRESPNSDKSVEVGVRKIFDRGDVGLRTGLRSEASDHIYFIVSGRYQATDRASVESSYQKGVDAGESSYLQEAGKKNEVNVRGAYKLLPSNVIYLFGSYKQFYSQDDIYIGDGYVLRGDWSKIWHSGFADLGTNLFLEYGNFDELKGKKSRGVMDKVVSPQNKVLPGEYLRIGNTFSYGLSSKNSYTRVWRPYFEVTPSYDLLLKHGDIYFNAGYGGSLFGQDKLKFDFSYGQSLSNLNSYNYGLNMSYELLY